MGIEPTLPRAGPGVLSQLNYGNIRQAAQDCCAVCGRGSAPKTAHGVFRQRQMGKWRDRTEALHAGNRTRTAKACATDGTPSLLLEDNRSTSAHRKMKMVRKPGVAPGPSRSQREVLLLHHDPDWNWSPWSDSHRRIRVYETRPVAAEAQGLKWCPRQELHL